MQHVHVTTSELGSDKPRQHVVIDHDEHEHRVWLGKHCFWAMRSGRQVVTYPTDEPVSFRPPRHRPAKPADGREDGGDWMNGDF